MRRILSLIPAIATATILGACGGTDVVVQALGQEGNGEAAAQAAEAVPLAGIQIQLLPFDRDAIFASLAESAAEPEPALPDTLLALQEQIAAANVEYQRATAEWSTVRDSLRQLSEEMEALHPASPEYRLLFEDFEDLEARVTGLENTMNQSFQRFSQLQGQFTSQAEEIRLVRAQWADEAFASVDSIFEARIEETGKEPLTDTTGANGAVRFESVASGDWWVHARYELPYEELYWNEHLQVEGERMEVQLTRENAESRARL
ncbi:MAG TPA: hypothetical protein VMN78_05385 [Longimicrobiales bacterium]|nr:hypothetical protein [Longimicrobiales bacterium]